MLPRQPCDVFPVPFALLQHLSPVRQLIYPGQLAPFDRDVVRVCSERARGLSFWFRGIFGAATSQWHIERIAALVATPAAKWQPIPLTADALYARGGTGARIPLLPGTHRLGAADVLELPWVQCCLWDEQQGRIRNVDALHVNRSLLAACEDEHACALGARLLEDALR